MSNENYDWNSILNTMKKDEKGNKKDGFKDEPWKANIFNPKIPSSGNWQGVIRFLPRPTGDGDMNPSLKVCTHSYQGPNGWYIELCPTTYDSSYDSCPACKKNGQLYKMGGTDLVGDRARKTYYYSNILVVKDPQNPENEGKVFIYRYGKKMYETIKEKMFNDTGIIETCNVFHPFEGTNFKLTLKTIKTKLKNGKEITYPSADGSTFYDSVVPLSKEVADKAMKNLHNLSEICSPEKIKSFDQLVARFEKVEGESSASSSTVGSYANRPTNVAAEDLPSYHKPVAPEHIQEPSSNGFDDEDDFIRSLNEN